jgi:uncharacterized protein YkwD
LTFSSLSRRLPVLTLALIGLALSTAAPLALGSGHRSPASIDRVERAVMRGINGYRRHFHLRPLHFDGRMNIGANQHSRSMAAHAYFAHSSANGSSWDGRVRHYSRARYVGEVIGWTSRTSPAHQARLIVSTWIHSAPHRAVLLKRGFIRGGVARARGGSRTYFTVDFAGHRR